MVRLFTAGGKGINELALIFSVSQRTVQRALKNSLSLQREKGKVPLRHP